MFLFFLVSVIPLVVEHILKGLVVDSEFVAVETVRYAGDPEAMTVYVVGEVKVEIEDAGLGRWYLCSECISMLLRVTIRFPDRVELTSSMVEALPSI